MLTSAGSVIYRWTEHWYPAKMCGRIDEEYDARMLARNDKGPASTLPASETTEVRDCLREWVHRISSDLDVALDAP